MLGGQWPDCRLNLHPSPLSSCPRLAPTTNPLTLLASVALNLSTKMCIKSHFGVLSLTISPVCEYRILRAAGHHEVVAYIESCICVLLHHHHHRCCGGWGLLTQRHEDLTLTSASCQFAATTATAAAAAATTHSSVVVTFSCSLLLSNIHGV